MLSFKLNFGKFPDQIRIRNDDQYFTKYSIKTKNRTRVSSTLMNFSYFLNVIRIVFNRFQYIFSNVVLYLYIIKIC